MSVSRDANGFTVVTPSGTPQDGLNTGAPAAGTTMIIFVSSSTGKDPGDVGFNNAIKGSTSQPYRTIDAGLAVLRNGSPDWLLLARGDTWTEGGNNLPGSGKSDQEPWLISNWIIGSSFPPTPNPVDASAYPIIQTSSALGVVFATSGALPNGGNNTIIMGIDGYAYTRDPTGPGYNPATLASAVGCFGNDRVFTSFLIEDCWVRYFYEGIGIHNDDPIGMGFSSGLSIRRCVIRNGYGVDTSGGNGIKIGGINGAIIEENVVNNWYYYSDTIIFVLSGTITVNPTGGAVYRNSGYAGSGGPFDFTVVSYDSANKFLTCTRTAGKFPDAVSGTLTKQSGTGDASLTFTLYNMTTPGNYGFIHNIYCSAYVTEFDPATVGTYPTITGNIFAREPSSGQIRDGGILSNNLWVECPQSYAMGVPISGVNATITNDVYTEGKTNYVANTADGPGTGGTDSGNHEDTQAQYALGNINFSGCVFANAIDSGQTVDIEGGFDGNFDSQCAMYNWSGVGPVLKKGSILTYRNITPGSGGAYPTFTGFIDNGAGGGTYTGVLGNILTITSISGTPMTNNMKLSGTGIPATVFIHTQLTGTPGGAGTYRLSINYSNRDFVGYQLAIDLETISVDAFWAPITTLSGVGVDAYGYVQLSAGGVSAITTRMTACYGVYSGTAYAPGDSVSISSGLIGGCTSFQAEVDTVTTIPNNSRTSSFPDPTRTVARYDAEVLGGPGTVDHFLSLAIQQRKSNWDTKLTGNAVSAWIRDGFGIGSNQSEALSLIDLTNALGGHSPASFLNVGQLGLRLHG